jgi:hypothetical protein
MMECQIVDSKAEFAGLTEPQTDIPGSMTGKRLRENPEDESVGIELRFLDVLPIAERRQRVLRVPQHALIQAVPRVVPFVLGFSRFWGGLRSRLFPVLRELSARIFAYR